MTYGDGSGTYFDVLTSIDVAHEIGHAVCENNKLSVPKESGAMNEAFSDIWELVSNITQHLENLLG
jgi:Zn-dependent metalloprotease